MKTIEKTFIVTATPTVMERFERFLCFFHFNDGHSGLFAMPFDGDGSDRLRVEPEPARLNNEHHIIANSGCELEIALNDCYKAYSLDRSRNSYITKDGELLKQIQPAD